MLRITPLPAVLFLTFFFTGCTEMQWQKAGADEASMARDEQECHAKARANAQRSGPVALPPVGDPRFGPPMGSSSSDRLMQANEELARCMKEKGYRLVPEGK
ncbi:MAG: hypothetical protein ACRET8_07525 [Burkholderiales bacterium]